MTPGAARSRAAARVLWATLALLGALVVTTAPATRAATPSGGPSVGAGPSASGSAASGPGAPGPVTSGRSLVGPAVPGAVRTVRGDGPDRSARGASSGTEDRSRTDQRAPAVPLWTAASAGGSTAGPVPVADLPRTPPAVAPPAGPGPPAPAPTRTASRPATPGVPRAPPSAA